MYKAVFKINTEAIEADANRIFTPFINCYEIHSVVIYFGGVLIIEENSVFTFEDQFTLIDVDELGFSLSGNDNIFFDINYFYIKPKNTDILSFVIDNAYSNVDVTNKIISAHYINGQFSLDNGLYKNAVLNYGTCLEGILNKELDNKMLNTLIEDYVGEANKSDMHFIRKLRNKVHPNRINDTQDITRSDAIKARNYLERILKLI